MSCKTEGPVDEDVVNEPADRDPIPEELHIHHNLLVTAKH